MGRRRNPDEYRVREGMVVDRAGGVLYDYLEPGEAELIAELVNAGIDPAWDNLEPHLKRLKRRRGWKGSTA